MNSTVSAGLNLTGQIVRAAVPVVHGAVQSVSHNTGKVEITFFFKGSSYFEEWQTGFGKP